MMNEWFEETRRLLSEFSFNDFVDILCVSVIIYYIYKFIRGRQAGKLAIGVIFFIFLMVASDLFGMHVIQYLMSTFFQVGIIALVIVFQPELRSALEKLGSGSIRGIKSIGEQKNASEEIFMINQLSTAMSELSKTKTGALVVIERSTKLGEMILTGTILDAEPSSFLIRNIFHNKAPLHDGALIIRKGRLHAAGCLLPLSANPDIIKDLGTRHRAAIGMSESSDAVIVVVSEETGVISIAFEGKLRRGFNEESLKAFLEKKLLPEGSPKKITSKFSSLKKRKKNSYKQKTNVSDERGCDN